jgi:hypothetical protein
MRLGLSKFGLPCCGKNAQMAVLLTVVFRSKSVSQFVERYHSVLSFKPIAENPVWNVNTVNKKQIL